MSEGATTTPTVRRVCSSLRTTCCGVRIKNEATCPRCQREVLPLTLEARWEHVRHMEAILEKLRDASGAGGAR